MKKDLQNFFHDVEFSSENLVPVVPADSVDWVVKCRAGLFLTDFVGRLECEKTL